VIDDAMIAALPCSDPCEPAFHLGFGDPQRLGSAHSITSAWTCFEPALVVQSPEGMLVEGLRRRGGVSVVHGVPDALRG
jgi:hypothetical protein